MVAGIPMDAMVYWHGMHGIPSMDYGYPTEAD